MILMIHCLMQSSSQSEKKMIFFSNFQMLLLFWETFFSSSKIIEKKKSLFVNFVRTYAQKQIQLQTFHWRTHNIHTEFIIFVLKFIVVATTIYYDCDIVNMCAFVCCVSLHFFFLLFSLLLPKHACGLWIFDLPLCIRISISIGIRIMS